MNEMAQVLEHDPRIHFASQVRHRREPKSYLRALGKKFGGNVAPAGV